MKTQARVSGSVTLKDLQADFKQYLMSGQSGIRERISNNGSLGADFRLNIYANAYVLRLEEALENDFEALAALLGEQDFFDLCQAYIKQHPSTFTSLRWFGQYMSDFLKQTPPYNTQQHMIELAMFEWNLVDAFNAGQSKTVTEQMMAELGPERWPDLVLEFNPSVQLCQYSWNIIPIWQAMRQEQPMPAPEPLDQMHYCLIWREDLKTRFRTLEADEALLLPLAYDGANFSVLCEKLSHVASDEVALRAVMCLKTWINAGLIAALKH